jgi:zinc/manganese transport system ATP-binding protein
MVDPWGIPNLDCSARAKIDAFAMANPANGLLWRRSAEIATRLTALATDAILTIVGATLPIVRRLARALRTLASVVKAELAVRLDGGYHPDAPAISVEHQNGAAIELESVSVAYGERLALQSLSGRFEAASLTAIVGPNGAGKSTLLKALTGLLPLQSGRLRCSAITRSRYAYLPQQADLNRDFPINVGELVALGGWRRMGAFRDPPEALTSEVAAAIEAVRLADLVDRRIGDLSPGEFQRALFARLLLQDAAVILLDEPFAALDEKTAEDLLGIVRRWPAEGRTVIAVLHDLDQVRKHFPSTLLLARSCIAWGKTDAVLTPENLAGLGKALGSPSQSSIFP